MKTATIRIPKVKQDMLKTISHEVTPTNSFLLFPIYLLQDLFLQQMADVIGQRREFTRPKKMLLIKILLLTRLFTIL